MNIIQIKRAGLWFQILDVFFNIVVIVVIVAGIRIFLISPFQVEGNSMVNTLEDNEYIIINKVVYILGDPKRGDIVVFHPPNDPSKYYVKRVIGLPGDEITIGDGNVFLHNTITNTKIPIEEESYLDSQNTGQTFKHPPGSGDKSAMTYDVPEGHYFLLGDNRQGSLDSRSFMIDGQPAPFVRRDEIKGKVWFVALPITKIHALGTPNYGL
jgi:signal peptidase I